MRHLLLVAALLAAFPAGAATFTRTPTGSSSCDLGPGRVCYALFTATDLTAYIRADSCEQVKVRFWSNLTSSTDHDATLTVNEVPEGVTSGTHALARAVPYRDVNAAAQTALTGETATGRDVLYAIQPESGLALVATSPGAPQVSLASVKCIGNSGD